MNDPFTRRGFLGLSAAAGVGLCLPALPAGAQDRLRFVGRLEPISDGGRVRVDLHLRHDGARGVELTGNALVLEAELTGPSGDHSLTLHALPNERRWLSRSMRPVEATLVVVPPGREQRYGGFVATWPPGLAPTGVRAIIALSAHVRLDPRSSLPPAERRALGALDGLPLAAEIVRPA